MTAGKKVTEEQIRQGNLLFDQGGVSQAEVARTLGLSESAIRNNFPGRKLTEEQTRERIILAQKERRLREKESSEKSWVR